jgi:hypothetical protein
VPAAPPVRRRPPGRYDAPSRAVPRLVAVALSVLFLGFLVALAWAMYLRFGTGSLPAQVIAFELQDDGVRVEFEVTPPQDGTAWCLVRSRNAAGEEIGREFVEVGPADGGGVVRVEHRLATRDRPVTGEVPRCRATPPADGEPTARPADAPSP